MKKISAFILFLALTLALTACGERSNSKDNDSSTKKEPQSSSQPTESKESGSTIAGDVGNIVIPTPVIPPVDGISSNEQTSSQNGGNITAVTPSNTQSNSSATASKPSSTTTSKPSSATTSKPSGTTNKPTPTPSTPSGTTTSKQPVKINEFKNYNNAVFTTNEVTIRPQHVYWQNGVLHADCYVLNGRSTRVTNINVKSLSFSNSKGVIASATFNILNNGRVVEIDGGKYIVWTFTFPTNCVISPNADLSSLDCSSNIAYSYYNS